LLELAAEARLAGRRDVERSALLTCRKRAAGQPAAAQAAYLLGRASAGAEAAQWFETYLREQPGGLLAREASGRLIESYNAAGNTSAAAQAASRYLTAYPHGPHASMARRALGARSESQD
jgi:TolA-binding protein